MKTVDNFAGKVLRAWQRLSSEFLKFLFRLFRHRPGSHPFISGDGFRSLAPWVWDEWVEPAFKPEQVKSGDLIFISNWNMERFWREYDPLIRVPYTLISSNGDTNLTGELSALRRPDTLCLHWFSQNVMVKDPRITPLPIGLENAALHWHGNLRSFRKLQSSPPDAKQMRILFGFSVENFRSEREKVKKILEAHPLADPCPKANPFQYREVLSRYAFVASPPGNGEDCHRTWEALYARTVPIVRRSPLMEYFSSLGIPVWIVDDWSLLASLTEEDLEREYRSRKDSFARPEIFVDFWVRRIHQVRSEVSGC